MNSPNFSQTWKLDLLLPMIILLALQAVCIAAEPANVSQAVEPAKVSQGVAEPAEAPRAVLPGLLDENPLKVGPVTVHPHLKVGFTYDDNVFIQQSARIGDFYASVDPGMQFVYGELGGNRIALDYTADAQEFFRLSNQDTVNHDVVLDGNFKLNQLSLNFRQEYQHLTEAVFAVGNRITGDYYRTSLGAEYELSPKTSFDVHYRQEIDNYATAGLINNQTFEPGTAFYYHLTPKTDLLAELNGGMVTVGQGANGVYEQLNVGARFRMTDKLTGRATAGYQHWDFDQGIASIDVPAANIGVTAQLTKHCSLDVNISNIVSPSPNVVSDYYTATRAYIRLNERLWHDKITVYVGGGYERDEYQQPIAGQVRNDDHLEAQAGVDYYIQKWWNVGLTYRYQNQDSTLPGIPFYDNQVSIFSMVRF